MKSFFVLAFVITSLGSIGCDTTRPEVAVSTWTPLAGAPVADKPGA